MNEEQEAKPTQYAIEKDSFRGAFFVQLPNGNLHQIKCTREQGFQALSLLLDKNGKLQVIEEPAPISFIEQD